jgi:hypothetical protein
VLLGVFLFVITNDTVSACFGLIVVGELRVFNHGAALVLWFLARSAIWRAQVFDRLFGARDVALAGREGYLSPHSAVMATATGPGRGGAPPVAR